MNWEAVSAIAAVVGALVVMVSVVYLATQVRQANLQAQGSAHADWLIAWNDTIKGWITDQETIEVLRRGWSDFDSLSKTQQAIFHLHHSALINQWLLAAQLCDRGLLPKSIYEGVTEILISVHSTSGGRVVLERNAQGTPRGEELLQLVRSNSGKLPAITVLFPWWSAEEEPLALENAVQAPERLPTLHSEAAPSEQNA